MTDKEVGDLWRGSFYGGAEQIGSNEIVRALIRKLVEERVKVYTAKRRTQGLGVEEETAKALRDFGIEPKDWK